MTEPTPASLELSKVIEIVGAERHWRVLATLADGGSLLSSEIAARCGLRVEAVSKTIGRLRELGVVIAPRGRLYEIAPQFLSDPAQRHVSIGPCLLKLNEVGPRPIA